MANYYCEGSTILVVSPDKMDSAKEVVNRKIDELERDEPCGVSVDFESEGIWFHGEASFNPDHTAYIAQGVLDELEFDEPFVFGWAYSCSKPRQGSFGGGACALKRGEDPCFVDAEDTASRHLSSGGSEPGRERVPDARINHIWKNAENDDCTGGAAYRIEVGPDWYEKNGTPICPFCGSYMEYSHTEIER